MDTARTDRDGIQVSVIIPARNEETILASCLQSLVAQSGVTFEIIVVDDQSTDRTHEITSSFSSQGVHVLEAGPLPANWTGKNNALVTGVKAACGQWLLFTDADTIHLPGSLARALEEASRNKADMLSYSPQQIVESFWEKSIMPVIFAELAITYRPSRVSNPKSTAAAANGQYILITHEAYDFVGGHAAIADQILEDVALARAVKRSGRKIFFRYAADAVRTRMYRNFGQLREGWTKNLALLFPTPLRLAAIRMLEFLLIVTVITMSITFALQKHWSTFIFSAILAILLYGLFLKRILRAHFSWNTNALALLGLPLFSYLLLRSKRFHQHGLVSWKGRTYSKSTANEMPSEAHAHSNACHPEHSEEPAVTGDPRLARTGH
jgi:glycosyltransferase involved in cell wall biosynthesis